MANNALITTQQSNLTFDEMSRAAKAMATSGYFRDAADVSKAMVKVLAGQEMGLGPFASMTGIHIIKGKPVVGASLIATMVKNDPRYDYKVETCDNDVAVLVWYERGQRVGKSSFTMTEAKQAGLANKDNWRNYASDMLFARALTRGARRYAPGIFGGAPIYVPEELGGDVDQDGYIEGQIVDTKVSYESGPDNTDAIPVEEEAGPAEQVEPNDMTLPQFRDWYLENGEQKDYYLQDYDRRFFRVVGVLKKHFGDNIGVDFKNRALVDYERALDEHAINKKMEGQEDE